jgi:UDP-glucose 4-epimerase
LAAIEYLKSRPKFEVFNLGTGVSYSVLELIYAYEKVIGRKIQFKFSKRRDGDLPISYASAQKASEVLNWSARKDLYEMCRSAWEFEAKQSNE